MMELDTITSEIVYQLLASKFHLQKLTAMANMLPPLNFVGSDRCCAVHIETAAMNISDVVIIALMLMYVWCQEPTEVYERS